MIDAATAARTLGTGLEAGDAELTLALGEFGLRLRSNSPELIERLRDYFRHVVAPVSEPDVDMVAWEQDVVDAGVSFTDWAREPGKTGRKDAYVDLEDGRLILKVRTGMVFLQSVSQVIAAGPCLEYDNQVINFINAQYMNWLQHRGWMICHAAGLVHGGRGLGLAGFSGGGKSTLMLHILEQDGVAFLTNDRLFVRQEGGKPQALGIPKLPRINPGTVVHNPRLESLIEPERRAELLALPPGELWEIEEKFDADIERLYGPGRIVHAAPLPAFLILNWSRESSDPWKVERINIAQRRDLLAAVMKSPGPFYQYDDGSFFTDDTPFDVDAYLAALEGVSFYEVTGRIDFDGVARHCVEHLMEETP